MQICWDYLELTETQFALIRINEVQTNAVLAIAIIVLYKKSYTQT